LVPLLERVSRNVDERLKQFPQTAEVPANPLILNGHQRRVSPLAFGGKAHQHAEGAVHSHLDIRREMEFALLAGSTDEDYRVADPLPNLIPGQTGVRHGLHSSGIPSAGTGGEEDL
jgi:hypothetical protein